MRILGFGSYDPQVHPRAGVLLAGLGELGEPVAELRIPLGLSTAARVSILAGPWRLPALAARLARCWVQLVSRARRERPDPDVVLVGYLGQFDVHLARWLFPRATVVLDQLVSGADTAADRGLAGGPRGALLRRLDRAACGAADVVLVDTAENAALVPRRYADRVVVAPVGAPRAWFADRPRPAGSGDGPLRVIFFGLFTPLQGAVTMAAAAALLDPALVQLTMVGSGQQLAAARAAAGDGPVRWVPWVASDELPALVAGSDVCLGIVGTTDKALRVVPNKVFQGAAAGCAVVTGDTAPQRRLLGEAACYVRPGDAGDLAAALTRLAGQRAEVTRLGEAARALALAAFTPAAVAAPLREALAARGPGRISRPGTGRSGRRAAPPPR